MRSHSLICLRRPHQRLLLPGQRARNALHVHITKMPLRLPLVAGTMSWPVPHRPKLLGNKKLRHGLTTVLRSRRRNLRMTIWTLRSINCLAHAMFYPLRNWPRIDN